MVCIFYVRITIFCCCMLVFLCVHIYVWKLYRIFIKYITYHFLKTLINIILEEMRLQVVFLLQGFLIYLCSILYWATCKILYLKKNKSLTYFLSYLFIITLHQAKCSLFKRFSSIPLHIKKTLCHSFRVYIPPKRLDISW